MIHQKVTGIVLAGGKSSRMGTDKALLLFRGKPLIQHAVDILQPVCGRVVISTNSNVYQFTGCEMWPDDFAGQAPMIGIYSCLRRSSSSWNIFLSCDMPLVDTRLFDLLLSFRKQGDIIVPVHHNGCIEPLCGLYNRRVIPAIEQQLRSEQYGLQQLIRTSAHKLVEMGPCLAFYNSSLFTNVNTCGDFDLLSKS